MAGNRHNVSHAITKSVKIEASEFREGNRHFNIDQDKYNSSFCGRAPPLNYSTHYKHIVSFPAPKPANECSHTKGEPRFGWTRRCAKHHS